MLEFIFWPIQYDMEEDVEDSLEMKEFTGATKTFVTVSSYRRGLITELMGKMIIENKAYHGVALSTSME